jgi:mRNA-degrading endonuclease YafQ of YafQ-DinJ toxin-antitoxin module
LTRTIELSAAFKKDYKRAGANPRHAQNIRALYETASLLLAEDKPMPENFRSRLGRRLERIPGVPFKA